MNKNKEFTPSNFHPKAPKQASNSYQKILKKKMEDKKQIMKHLMNCFIISIEHNMSLSISHSYFYWLLFISFSSSRNGKKKNKHPNCCNWHPTKSSTETHAYEQQHAVPNNIVEPTRFKKQTILWQAHLAMGWNIFLHGTVILKQRKICNLDRNASKEKENYLNAKPSAQVENDTGSYYAESIDKLKEERTCGTSRRVVGKLC